jgi:hypothetical protein
MGPASARSGTCNAIARTTGNSLLNRQFMKGVSFGYFLIVAWTLKHLGQIVRRRLARIVRVAFLRVRACALLMI